MKPKTLSPWYTTERIVHHRTPIEVRYANGSHFMHFTLEDAPNGTLLSKGRYPTKLRPADLPNSYVESRIGRLHGYVDAKRISDAIYVPNEWVNHLWRDDSLFVKFDGGRFDERLRNLPNRESDAQYYERRREIMDGLYDTADLSFHGWDIVRVSAYITLYTDTDTASLRSALKAKVRSYRENHPNEHDAMSEAEFAEAWTRETQRIWRREIESARAEMDAAKARIP